MSASKRAPLGVFAWCPHICHLPSMSEVSSPARRFSIKFSGLSSRLLIRGFDTCCVACLCACACGCLRLCVSFLRCSYCFRGSDGSLLRDSLSPQIQALSADDCHVPMSCDCLFSPRVLISWFATSIAVAHLCMCDFCTSRRELLLLCRHPLALIDLFFIAF